MTVRIRLQRHGAKKRPFYRIVAADKRSKRDGRFIEQLGTFDPLHEPPAIRLNTERANYWLGVGAEPSQTVASLLKKVADGNGVDLAKENADRQAASKRRADKQVALEQRRADAIKAHQEAQKAEDAAAAAAKAAKAAPVAEAPAEAAAEAPAEAAAEAPAEAAAEDKTEA
jgi:small subunit ribosomal protein S16